MGYVLSLMIFLPLVGAVIALVLGSSRAPQVRWVALVTTLATLLLAVIVVANFTPRTGDDAMSAAISNKGPIQPQMEEVKIPWLTFDAQGNGNQFYLGIDGISLWLVALTALLMVPSVL